MATTDLSEWVLLDSDLTTRLAIMPALSSHLHAEINEPGSGSMTLPLDSTTAGLVTSGMFALLNYRGQPHDGFFIDNIGNDEVASDEFSGRVMKLSGRGPMAILEDATIYGSGSSETKRTFTSMTKAAILITLIDEAIARGGLSTLTYDFTATDDSNSASWGDSETLDLTIGASLLEVVRGFAEVGIEFKMTLTGGGFVLSAYSTPIGSNISSTIFFRTGINCEDVSSDQRAIDLKNAFQVKYGSGFIAIQDNASIAANRRRESLLNVEAAQTSASARTYAAARLAIDKNPQKAITLKVWDGVGPRIFLDYNIGDTISLDILGTIVTYRVLGLQCDFDGANFAEVVVELNSLMRTATQLLSRDVGWLLDQWNTAHDAGLLEVSFWAAIGNPNVSYSNFGTLIINSNYYILDSFILRWYDITNGGWSSFNVGASEDVKCMANVGGVIYIGCLGKILKFDTSTKTLTTLATVSDTAVPLAAAITSIAAVGTKLYFSGIYDDIGGTGYTGVAEYDTVGNTWADIGGGGGTGVSVKSDGTYLYALISSQVWRYSGSWAQLGTFPVSVSTITSNFAAYDTGILVGTSAGDHLYYWDGSTWATFVVVSAAVTSIGVYLTDVYVTGPFTTEGNYISKYSGGSWWPLETGLNDVARLLLYQSNDNVDVYVAGAFTTAGGKPANEIAVYYNNFESLANYLENSDSSFNLGEAIHDATAKTSLASFDELPLWDSVTQQLRKITWANILATIGTWADALYVKLTGSQTIAGVKTFSSFPETPSSAPTTDYQVANKKYVDDNAGGGGGTWGSITGTLSAQTDLQTELDGKVANSGWTVARIMYTDVSGDVVVSDALVFNDVDGTFTIGDNGTTSPPMLGIANPAGTPSAWILTDFGGTIGVQYKGIGVSGSLASPTAVASGKRLVSIRGAGWDGTGNVKDAVTSSEIRVVATEDFDASGHGTKIEVYTTPNNTTTAALAFTIDQDGNVNIASGKEYRVNGAQHAHPHTHTQVILLGTALEDGTIASGASNTAKPFRSGLGGAGFNVAIPLAGTLKNLYFRTGSTQPASGSLTCTLNVNNSQKTVVATCPAGSAANTFSDTTHTYALSAGDVVWFDLKNNATGTSAQMVSAVIVLEFDTGSAL